MRIAIGCDHGGIVLKPAIIEYLSNNGIDYTDFGTDSTESCDYPDFAVKVADAVVKKVADKGILLCGTGIGITIAANKVRGIRAAVVSDEFSASACAEHNNANILGLGGRIVSPEKAVKLVSLWLNTSYAGGRHQKRIDKIAEIEARENCVKY
ncbi:MAG: ribose 5-phosphate isomerase B [Clostridia bacterium]|nr:ribose 5-phosphate isomerase B [Clostridia bacterium]